MNFPIFINRTKYETSNQEMIGSQILALAGFGTDHDLFLLQGEGDPSGGEPVGADQPIPIKAGLHFRAIPSNRNFG